MCIRDRHRGTHLVCVVRHIHHRHVGQLRRRVGVLTDAGKQAGREAGCGLHVVIGRKSGGLVGLCGIGLDLVGAVLEQRFHAAKALLESTARVDRVGDHLPDGGSTQHLSLIHI